MHKIQFKILNLLLSILSICFLQVISFSINNKIIAATKADNSIFGSQLRCNKVYPSVYEVSHNILKTIVSKHQKKHYSKEIKTLSHGIITMIKNMTLNIHQPIHPVAFFAMIKDFESGPNISDWSKGDFGFFSDYCSSGTCSGFFQVDVGLMYDWSLSNVCAENGLDILHLKGGADFCSLFYWLLDSNANNCSQFQKGSNICIDQNIMWTSDFFAKGYKVYGQSPQWGVNSWSKMYEGFDNGYEFVKGYKFCAFDHYYKTQNLANNFDNNDNNYDKNFADFLFLKSVAKFKANIGLDN